MDPNRFFSIPLPVILCVVSILLLLSFYVMGNTYKRHYYVGGEDGQLYKALHIALPGYSTVYYHEQEVDLQKWVGSKYDGLVAINKADNTENPEATAGLALKAAGLYTDDTLEKRDNHYILYRPARTEKFFTLKAYYRIWWGEKAS